MGIIDKMREGMKSAKEFGSGNWINPGRGVLLLKAIKYGGKAEGFQKGDTFIAEMLVETCEPFVGLKDAEGKEKQAGNPVGSSVTYHEALHGEFEESAFGRMMQYLRTLLNETPESLDAQAKAKVESKEKPADWTGVDELLAALQHLASKERPGCGLRIRYSTIEKTNKEKSKILTTPKFDPYPNTPETVAEGRKKVEGTIS